MENKAETSTVWFSQHFGINKPQYALSFVDFPLNRDVQLYIDSYAITKDPSDMAGQCHEAIVSYFQALMDAARSGNELRMQDLIKGRLIEPKEIHLGVAKKARTGVGLGRVQEGQIVNAIMQSVALKSGIIDELQELELHIDGLGPDKVSDLVANIIKRYLIEYTQKVCSEYGIGTRPCAVNTFWNIDNLEWDSDYLDLPVRENHSYILVPKKFVCLEKDTVNHRYFYDHYALEFFVREKQAAVDSLGATLKQGTRRITKYSVKREPQYALNKPLVSRFIREHPEIIDEYRKKLREEFEPIDFAAISGKAEQDDQIILDHLSKLDKINAGRDEATAYHNTAFELLQYIFDWCLQNFDKESKMDQNLGRIDIICDNYASGGYFKELREEFKASFIPMECKNYSGDLGNNEFNQLADRLSTTTSLLGFLFCRNIKNRDEMSRHVTQRFLRQERKCILVFDDQTLRELVNMRRKEDFKQIESLLRKMVRYVNLGTPSRLFD